MKQSLLLILLSSSLFLTGSFSPVRAAVREPIGPINLPGGIPGRNVVTTGEAREKIDEFVRGGIRIVFLIGLVGVLFFFSIGGTRWVFSAGDKQKIDQAKGMITAAIVGFAVLALSYITLYLIGTFFGIKIVQEPPKKSGTITPPGPIPSCSTPANQCVLWEVPNCSNCTLRECQMAYGDCKIKSKFTGGTMKNYCCPSGVSP